VIKDHISLGATWDIDRAQELSVAYTYGLKETVKGKSIDPDSIWWG
jgi:long-chain fatty acid transport protein